MRLLTDENVEHLLWKAKQGMALNLSELSIASGYSYSTWKRWHARGLPLVAGRISLSEGMKWARKHQVLSAPKKPSVSKPASPLLDAFDKRDAPSRRRGSQAA